MMHRRKLAGLGLSAPFLLVLCAGTPVPAAPPAPGEERNEAIEHERLEDPPAPRAARSVPELRSAALPVSFGPYTSIQVNVDEQGRNVVGDAANEPSLAVNPTNPANLVIAWRQFDNVRSNFRQAGWGFSRDGGRTWSTGTIDPSIFRSDPVVDVNAAGRFFYYSLTVDNDPFAPYSAQVFRSDDGGASWLPAIDGWGNDKIWLAVDRTGGPGEGNVYLTWSIGNQTRVDCGVQCCTPPLCCVGEQCCNANGCMTLDRLSRSLDDGESFAAPVPFFRDLAELPGPATLAVGPDGTLYSAAEVFVGQRSVYRLYRSENARFAAETPRFDTVPLDFGGGPGRSLANSPNPGGGLGQPEIAADPRPGSRRVFVLASVDPAGADPLDLAFLRSDDGGSTWSAPLRLNDDPAGNGAYQWFGTLAAAPNGRLDAVWNDTRNSGGDPRLSQLFYSWSYDGGRSWAKNVAVSPPWSSHVGWPNQNKIGDYSDLISDRAGAGVAYAATLNGEQDVWFVRVFPDCNGNGRSDVEDIAAGLLRDADRDDAPDSCDGSGGGGGGPLTLTGPDPGRAGVRNQLTVTGAARGDTVRFFLFDRPGRPSRIRECPGLSLGRFVLANLGDAPADAAGTAVRRVKLAASLARKTVRFQAVDLKTCKVSDVVEQRFP